MKHDKFGLIVLILSVVAVVAWIETAAIQTQQIAWADDTGSNKNISSDHATEPEQHFKKAHESFLKKDMKAAAAEIRKSVAFLKHEEESAESEGKKDLSDSEHALEKLADDVENGTVASVNELDRAFADAYYALARNHYLKSSEAWANKTAKSTGFSLMVSIHDLEHGFAWSDRKVKTESKAVIKDARHVSNKLMKGVGWVSSEVDKSIKDMGTEIDKFGKEISQKNMSNKKAK